ncbi:MAG TPA: hypothetical protein VF070_23215 [Streptosporangiaceae bacterium]
MAGPLLVGTVRVAGRAAVTVRWPHGGTAHAWLAASARKVAAALSSGTVIAAPAVQLTRPVSEAAGSLPSRTKWPEKNASFCRWLANPALRGIEVSSSGESRTSPVRHTRAIGERVHCATTCRARAVNADPPLLPADPLRLASEPPGLVPQAASVTTAEHISTSSPIARRPPAPTSGPFRRL